MRVVPTPHETAAPQSPQVAPVPSPREAAQRFAVAAAFEKIAKGQLAELRNDVAPLVFEPGDRLVAKSPADPSVKLAAVTATDPESTAKVTDPEAFHQWMRDNYPDRCEERDLLVGSTAQVIDALREHCPADVLARLVTTDVVPRDWATAEVLTLTKTAGAPVGPGGEMDENAPPGVELEQKPSVVQVRLEPGAVEHVRQVWDNARAAIPTPATPAPLPQ